MFNCYVCVCVLLLVVVLLVLYCVLLWFVFACVCDRVDLSMCNCVRRGIMLMCVCDVPLCRYIDIIIDALCCSHYSCHLLLSFLS